MGKRLEDLADAAFLAGWRCRSFGRGFESAKAEFMAVWRGERTHEHVFYVSGSGVVMCRHEGCTEVPPPYDTTTVRRG